MPVHLGADMRIVAVVVGQVCIVSVVMLRWPWGAGPGRREGEAKGSIPGVNERISGVVRQISRKCAEEGPVAL